MDVVARFRPSADASAISHIRLEEAQRQGRATHIFAPTATQADVITRLVTPHVTPMLEREGYSTVALAYGQTGSGKTHSIFGPPAVLTEAELQRTPSGQIPATWGVFPAAALALLQRAIESNAPLQLSLSAVEVYMDRVYDLLCDRAPVAMQSCKATSRRVDYAKPAEAGSKWLSPSAQRQAEREASAQHGASKVLQLATRNDVVNAARLIEVTRSSQAHNMNERSSRSHAVLTLTARVIRNGAVTSSTWVFADLAGSERVAKSGVDNDGGCMRKAIALRGRMRVALPGTRMDEARAVNSSLAALGRVLSAISRRDAFISFRDCTLTQLLKGSLTAPRCAVVVLLAIRSESSNDPETVSTFRFGAVCAEAGSAKAGAKRRSASCRMPSVSVQAAVRAARQELNAAEQDVERMRASGLDERVNTEGFADGTVRGFLHNKAHFEKAQADITAAKEAINEAKSRGDEAGVQRGQAALRQASYELNVYSGLFLRQVTTGIYTKRDPRLEEKLGQVSRLESEIAFLSGASVTVA